MRLTNATKVEDCFDGGTVFKYAFDRKWTAQTIRSLIDLGRLDYFPDFPRPFFRVCGKTGFQIKGVEGEETCLVVLPGKEKEAVERQLKQYFS